MKNKTAPIVVVGLVVVIAAVLGYFFLGSKVTAENYGKIETGMTKAEVEDILGSGTEKDAVSGGIGDLTGSGSIVAWGDDQKGITITFVNGKVATKSQKGL